MSGADVRRGTLRAVSENSVPGFLPSRNGFHFVNGWPPGPAVWLSIGPIALGLGNAADGLCGGMAFATRDRFQRGEVPPPDTSPPAPGTMLFREIVRRQIDSFDHLVRLPLRLYVLAALHPSGPNRWARLVGLVPRATLAVRDEWPKIRADIDGGRLSMLGLIRSTSANPVHLGHNHQVVAWAYDVSPTELTLRLYDPNWPDRDDVSIRVRLAGGSTVDLTQSTGEALFGFFRAPYTPP
jgi:hypothetical protein